MGKGVRLIPDAIVNFFNEHRSKAPVPGPLQSHAEGVLNFSNLPYLPISHFSGIDFEVMFEEAKALIPDMVQHREDYSKGWRSLTLHGLEWDKTEGSERYGLDPYDLTLYKWTEMAERAPVLKRFLQSDIHYEFFHRVRLMLLEPGGYILPHRDMRKYLLDPLNIALNHPPGCEFVFEDAGLVPFCDQRVIKLSLERLHSVVNNSAVPRVHLIVHGRPKWDIWNPWIMESYRKFRASL